MSLLLCCMFYLLLGIYSYKMDAKSKVNKVFFNLSMCCVLWSGGYAMMLISENINVAFFWRAVSVLGYCFVSGHWLYFAAILNSEKKNKFSSLIIILAHVPAIALFMCNVIVNPSSVMIKEYYGWIDVSPNSFGQIAFNIYAVIFYISGIIVLFFKGKNSKKNRIKKQNRIILSTCIISISIGIFTDIVLPIFGVILFPSAVLTGIIALGGVCYAISRHRFMLTAPKYISEYIYDTVNEPIFILNEDFTIQSCNKTSFNVTQYEFHELQGKVFGEFIYYENFDFNEMMEKSYVKNVEIRLQKKDGSNIICELSGTIIYDEYNDMLGILILLHDISERKKFSEIEKEYTLKLEETNLKLKNQIEDKMRAEKQILHYVYYDALTELPNRKMMLENLNMLLENNKEGFAILFLDLDSFKHINDNFGHQVGDWVLKNVAVRLKNSIGPQDSINRIGGDEFIIILTSSRLDLYIQETAMKIQIALKDPIVYDEEQLIIGASIGISIAPQHGDDSDTLIRKADIAMYEVKGNGGYDYAVYSSEMEDNAIDKLEMKMKLNKAVENNEFITYYQPIMDLKSMKVLYAEALIRWKQGEKIIPPIEFIPIAKRVGEIISIDNWMLRNSCEQCKKWNELGLGEFNISVNTSYSQLKQPGFVSLVKNILETYSLPQEYLNLEITEDEAMEDFDTIINILTQLKNIGVKISLDDFGTGYSSLSYVNKLPIDKIKIDRSLITNLEKNYKNTMIIKSIVEMGHSLNIKIVAEGIETEKQFEILKELKCDYIQGYLIGKPMGATEFEYKFINKSET
ncbi:EAL domain-containing protein [uncultured Clostridium sp.]|uniref:EAL domain-containing protein n=1 Tax=uncultured Clostridium sp. TaxID=59620 RepID=UPI0028EF98A9|nr:EAL domain-containing protein [uncultured Clostridium sp.]